MLTTDFFAGKVEAENGPGAVEWALGWAEDGDSFTVIEVNYTMEFRNSIAPTGVNIPGRIIDYVLEVGQGRPVRETAALT